VRKREVPDFNRKNELGSFCQNCGI
jgi:hypothetical protein